jgi:ribonuclease P/MRP protein subunit POP5
MKCPPSTSDDETQDAKIVYQYSANRNPFAQITSLSTTSMVRLKHRWLLIEILYPSSPPYTSPSPLLTIKLLLDLLRQSLSQNFGESGLALVAPSLSIRYLSPPTSTGIIRVAREHYRLVWAALTFLREVGGRECVVVVRRVCGTVKKAEQAILRRDKDALRNVRRG